MMNVKRRDLFDPAELHLQLRQLEQNGVDRVVISHEAISTLTAAQFQLLRQALAPYPLRIVLVLRHWIGFLPSRWQQNCRRRDGQSFGHFLTRMQAAPERFDMGFEQILFNLSAVPEDIIVVVPFERAVQAEGVVPAVLRACGLTVETARAAVPEGGAGKNQGYHLNAGRDGQNHEMLRLLNGCYARAQGWEQDEMFLAFGAGRLPREFFDMGRMLAPLESERPLLWTALRERLDQSECRTWLRQEDFAEAAQRLQQIAAPYLMRDLVQQNAVGMFPDLPAREQRWCALEAGDLPPALQEEVGVAVQALAQKLSWQPRFPAAGV